jgi:hypothetical protein
LPALKVCLSSLQCFDHKSLVFRGNIIGQTKNHQEQEEEGLDQEQVDDRANGKKKRQVARCKQIETKLPSTVVKRPEMSLSKSLSPRFPFNP